MLSYLYDLLLIPKKFKNQEMFIFQFIIFIGFILLLVVLGFVFRIMSAFGGRARYRSFSTHRQEENGSQAHSYTEDAEPKKRRKKKIFDQSVGEYVDFEEIKDK